MKFSNILCLSLLPWLCSAITSSQAAFIANRVRDFLPNPGNARADYVGAVVRLAAHDAMGSGGMDGCIDRSDPDNNGLDGISNQLNSILSDPSLNGVSRADLWALAAMVVTRATGGKEIVFEGGRQDCPDENLAINNDFLPQAAPQGGLGSTWAHVRDVFITRMQFTAQEVTALMGAHTLGRAQTQNSGFNGAWVGRNDEFDNDFFDEILDRPWRRRQQNGGQVWTANGGRIMLNTDIVLAVDPASCDRVGGNGGTNGCTINTATFDTMQSYANDNNLWLDDYSLAFRKLMAVNVPPNTLQVVDDMVVGPGRCDGFLVGQGVAGSQAACRQECHNDGDCAFYSYCPSGQPGCTGDHANLCARFGQQPQCVRSDTNCHSGYTSYQFLPGAQLLQGGNFNQGMNMNNLPACPVVVSPTTAPPTEGPPSPTTAPPTTAPPTDGPPSPTTAPPTTAPPTDGPPSPTTAPPTTAPPTDGQPTDGEFNGFNFDSCSGGADEFEVTLSVRDELVRLGEIPPLVDNVHVELEATNDLDVQVYDMDETDGPWPNGRAVVAWCALPCNRGLLDQRRTATRTYKGVDITYSGYDPLNSPPGNEFISFAGLTPARMSVGVFAYRTGAAKVKYSWSASATSCCLGTDVCGPFDFNAPIALQQIVSIGIIPAGKVDLRVELESDDDLDIQLYDMQTDTPIIAFCDTALMPNCQQGILGMSPGYGFTDYGSVRYEYSGFNGGGTRPTFGHEYIQLTGTLDRPLQMKAFGYRAGSAKVTYSYWEQVTTN